MVQVRTSPLGQSVLLRLAARIDTRYPTIVRTESSPGLAFTVHTDWDASCKQPFTWEFLGASFSVVCDMGAFVFKDSLFAALFDEENGRGTDCGVESRPLGVARSFVLSEFAVRVR